MAEMRKNKSNMNVNKFPQRRRVSCCLCSHKYVNSSSSLVAVVEEVEVEWQGDSDCGCSWFSSGEVSSSGGDEKDTEFAVNLRCDQQKVCNKKSVSKRVQVWKKQWSQYNKTIKGGESLPLMIPMQNSVQNSQMYWPKKNGKMILCSDLVEPLH